MAELMEKVCSEHVRTDVANSLAFATLNEDRVKYCPAWGKWAFWNGRHWEQDELGKVRLLLVDTLRQMRAYCEDKGNTRLARHLRSCESARTLNNVLEVAKPYLSVRTTIFDARDWELNCANGMLDLETGELKEHDRTHMHTRMVNANYEQYEENIVWNAFLEKIMPVRELRDFFQRSIGYSLTGSIREQCLFVLFGPTSNNGKSTLVEAVRGMFGSYASATDPRLLLERGTDAIRSDVARLQGTRFVTATEISGKKVLDTIMMKQLTGKDAVVARELYEREKELRPTWKIFLASNDLPEIPAVDPALRRRFKIIPFDVKIKRNEVDLDMLEKLEEERDGILHWAVEGALRWMNDGLGDSQLVERLTDAYLDEQDSFGAYFMARCKREQDARITKERLYADYCEWCKGMGFTPSTKRAIGVALQKEGYVDCQSFDPEKGRTSRFWHGIKLNVGIRMEDQI